METAPPPMPTNSFLKQLGFWGLHCGLTSLPSFCIALTRFNKPGEILGMVCGIFTFIFGYAFLTSASFYGKLNDGLIGNSVKMGARIRMWISLCSLPVLLSTLGQGDPSPEMMFVPDMWFGLAALTIYSLVSQIVGIDPTYVSTTSSGELGIVGAYCITVIEGVLISVSLILIAFISLVVMNYRRNRRRLPSDFIPR